MSQANVDRLLESAEEFNRWAAGESTDISGFLRYMDPDVRFDPVQSTLEGGYAGHDGVMAWLADIGESYEKGSIHYDDVRDLGDRVLALGTLRLTGRGSGIDIEVPVALVATFRDGLLTELKDYGDRDKALARWRAG
jgi:ketosteroid isomerase-like protein